LNLTAAATDGWPRHCPSIILTLGLRENGTFFEFSLCLSRACLGKKMTFIHKWLKKPVFLPVHRLNWQQPPASSACEQQRTPAAARPDASDVGVCLP
jgi:hypothetical protein